MSARVRQFADQLRQHATHFEVNDWCYTRNLGDLRALRYVDPYERPLARAKRALRCLTKIRKDDLDQVIPVNRFLMALCHLKRDNRLPDGVLDGGGIITVWEETGEYLQYVQPSVGALLADLMDAHPDLPEVQAIADEMKRINDDYGRRIAEDPS